jgi:putative acetyltransferase
MSAFAEDERDIVSKLAVNLLAEESTPQTISLVAETEGIVVGHVAFSPVSFDNNEHGQGYILAPLGVKPDYQKCHIGSKLIESGMQQLSRMGVDILFVYGDPEYYGRFGFSVDAAECYIPPYKLQYPFGWQGLALNECSTGKSSIKIACVTSLCDPALW